MTEQRKRDSAFIIWGRLSRSPRWFVSLDWFLQSMYQQMALGKRWMDYLCALWVCISEVFLFSFFFASLYFSRLLLLAKTNEVSARRCVLEPSKREKRSASLSLYIYASLLHDSPSPARFLFSWRSIDGERERERELKTGKDRKEAWKCLIERDTQTDPIE